MWRAEISEKETTNDASPRKEEKRGWDYQIHSFLLVSDFVGQGVGERTHWPIPVSQTHSQIKLKVSLWQNASFEKNNALVEKQHKHSLFSHTLRYFSFLLHYTYVRRLHIFIFSPLFIQQAQNMRAVLGPTISH